MGGEVGTGAERSFPCIGTRILLGVDARRNGLAGLSRACPFLCLQRFLLRRGRARACASRTYIRAMACAGILYLVSWRGGCGGDAPHRKRLGTINKREARVGHAVFQRAQHVPPSTLWRRRGLSGRFVSGRQTEGAKARANRRKSLGAEMRQVLRRT